jgi:DNA helicase-2/ATP-dependent DNA helicase PcrA
MSDQRDFQVGDKVQHPEFGDGLVLESRGSGDKASVLVSFDDKVKRKLAVRFAKLTLLAPAQTREPPRGPRAPRG